MPSEIISHSSSPHPISRKVYEAELFFFLRYFCFALLLLLETFDLVKASAGVSFVQERQGGGSQMKNPE